MSPWESLKLGQKMLTFNILTVDTGDLIDLHQVPLPNDRLSFKPPPFA